MRLAERHQYILNLIKVQKRKCLVCTYAHGDQKTGNKIKFVMQVTLTREKEEERKMQIEMADLEQG